MFANARQTLSVLSPLLAACWLAGCGDAAQYLERPPDFERRDSAGVTIVDNRIVEPRFMDIWSVDTTPALTIGVSAGDDPAYEFPGVRGVLQMPDGNIVVLNGEGEAAYEFRIFDATGKHLATHGRRGQGPGEFRWVNFFGPVGGDTLVAVDFPAARLTWISVSGGIVRSEQVDDSRLKQIVGRDASGLIETMVPINDTLVALKAFRRAPDATSLLERQLSFHLVDLAAGTTRDLLSFRDAQVREVLLSNGPSYLSTRAESPLPMHVVDRERERICAAVSNVAEITCVNAQNQRTIFRWVPDTIRYTEADKNAREDGMRKAYANSSRMTEGDVEKLIDLTEYPDHFNFIISMLLDVEGNFWVGENAVTRSGERFTRFRVLNPDGEQIAFADAFPTSIHSNLNSTIFVGADFVFRKFSGPEGADRVGVFRINKAR